MVTSDRCGRIWSEDTPQHEGTLDHSRDQIKQEYLQAQNHLFILAECCRDIAKGDVVVKPLKKNSSYIQGRCTFDGAQDFVTNNRHNWVILNGDHDRYIIEVGSYDRGKKEAL
ncbi:hypothetical protein GUITHDRAFT_132184 [Guillardia theta CCMP2712]|uniref:Uncharacterized protein n=1 Tax=Guillardia theta (strain CCMP2712) TaxID=905079 RepID=L1K1H3_GUITC|nr:hypothetical protein GUITHDRAFT_132184 [Guillardia theta CCMP2712]EKX54457.1 hypothetical protein GUITHDRAFT_132184 [Guillardia theta CCMP2712]|eukprot:XP_005841437.1 hypothetical protein GUITHDRAFT_132184 [Guillardia theta CCMP2712]